MTGAIFQTCYAVHWMVQGPSCCTAAACEMQLECAMPLDYAMQLEYAVQVVK